MLDDLLRERRKKLENLTEAGFYPYPEKIKNRAPIKKILEEFDMLSSGEKTVAICGRIAALRDQGKIIFYDVADESGRMQTVLKSENLGGEFKLFKENLDLGDFIEVQGLLFLTQTKEKSLEIKELRPIVKTLRPLPDKWHGLEDVETRLRKRYLDILTNPEEKEIFFKKNIFWQNLRSFLQKKGFLEVETPILEATPGGADAEPFLTHHNALNTDFYLRISLEISLKKLLVAGFEKVFEIGRIFRNEGIDAEHLQDYTQLELYWTYADYNDLMKFIEKMYKQVIKNVTGGLKTNHQGTEIDWSERWPKIEYSDAFRDVTKIDPILAKREDLIVHLNAYKKDKKELIPNVISLGKGRLIDAIFKREVRPLLNNKQPCFLINPPVEIEPLAKRKEKYPNKVSRFQVMACGTELGKGFSEANDPVDQRERLEEQMRLREKGDKEAQRLDEDFLEALEYGMPPAAGFGMSERLFAVLMDKPVRETVIFPLMRRK